MEVHWQGLISFLSFDPELLDMTDDINYNSCCNNFCNNQCYNFTRTTITTITTGAVFIRFNKKNIGGQTAIRIQERIGKQILQLLIQLNCATNIATVTIAIVK